MPHNPVILDTNAVLRWILKDVPEQAIAVETLIISKRCLVTLEVVAEVVYVLEDYYNLERQVISDTIALLASHEIGLVSDSDLLIHAMQVYASSNKLDFVDCLLDGYAKIKKYSVFTFDKDLKIQLELRAD
jgi:predicted nucleic-acid-binding protein